MESTLIAHALLKVKTKVWLAGALNMAMPTLQRRFVKHNWRPFEVEYLQKHVAMAQRIEYLTESIMSHKKELESIKELL